MQSGSRRKIVDLGTLLPILAELRRGGKRVVQCHGCFDVVHPGHIRHLSDAATHGDLLVVSVTADPQVQKGSGRPMIPQELRCENLAALTMVDFVVVDKESWAGPILESIRPDVYVKGLEYQTNNDPRFLREKQIVEEAGGVVLYTSGEVVYSSTRLQRDFLDRDDLRADWLRALVARHGLTRQGLLRRLESFPSLRLLVVGDLVLDHYVECEQGESSNEAPMLQVTPIDERFYVGGAGVLALHAAALGADVTFLGFVRQGNTADGPDPVAILEAGGVRVLAIAADARLTKTRYLVEGQKVFKVNRARALAISSAQEEDWLARIRRFLQSANDGLLAVDFGYGSLSRPRMRKAAELARAVGARVFADTSSHRTASLSKFFGLGCDCIYPTEAEARAYLGEPELGLPLLVSKLFSHNIAQGIALTLGPRGLVFFDRRRRSTEVDGTTRYLPEYLPSLARHAVDPLGAGDALTTVASLARMAGSDYIEALLLGSLAAAQVVERIGNEPIHGAAMLRMLESHPMFDDGPTLSAPRAATKDPAPAATRAPQATHASIGSLRATDTGPEP